MSSGWKKIVAEAWTHLTFVPSWMSSWKEISLYTSEYQNQLSRRGCRQWGYSVRTGYCVRKIKDPPEGLTTAWNRRQQSPFFLDAGKQAVMSLEFPFEGIIYKHKASFYVRSAKKASHLAPPRKQFWTGCPFPFSTTVPECVGTLRTVFTHWRSKSKMTDPGLFFLGLSGARMGPGMNMNSTSKTGSSTESLSLLPKAMKTWNLNVWAGNILMLLEFWIHVKRKTNARAFSWQLITLRNPHLAARSSWYGLATILLFRPASSKREFVHEETEQTTRDVMATTRAFFFNKKRTLTFPWCGDWNDSHHWEIDCRNVLFVQLTTSCPCVTVLFCVGSEAGKGQQVRIKPCRPNNA